MPVLWLANLAAYSLQVAALVVAAALIVLALGIRAPRVRLAIWQALLLACLALPFVQPWRQAAATVGVAEVTVLVTSVEPARADARRPLPTAVLAAVLLAGALLRLVWLGLGLARLARYRRDMVILDPAPPALEKAIARAGVRATLAVAHGLNGPVTFGVRRPVVLLPPAVLALDPQLQCGVVCHELLHVRRRDWIRSLVEEAICAIAWFHPAVWWLAAQIDLAREQHVDAEVVRLIGDRKPYLEALLYLASPGHGADLAPAPALLRRRHLAKRLLVLVTEVSMTRSRIVLSVAILGAVLALTAGAAAVSFPLVGRPSEEPTATLSQVQAPLRVGGNIKPPRKIYDVRPVYPPDARDAGIQGVVILEVSIAPDGTVADANVLRSVPTLDEAAVEAVRQWVFEPTLLNGEPVPVIMTVTVNFTLDTGRSTGGAPGGVTGGVTGGVAGGVTGSVAGGVTGGVPKAVKREPPRRIYYVAPAYPDDARAQGVQGVAILQVTIETDGAPSDVKVIRGDVLLAQSAIDAVQQWRWTPPAKAVVATVTVRFALDDAKVAAEAVGPSSGHPRVVREVKPLYPPDLLKAKMAGAVTVEAIVGTDGRVLAARVLKGSDVFHQAALDAVRQWEFEPPDRPVKVAIDLTFSVR